MKPTVKLYIGNSALTAEKAKKLLGWTAEKEEKFKSDFLLKDSEGTKIRCENNVSNRPLYKSVYLTLQQEILNKRWQFNGESIIIGDEGAILNGQHTLVALVLAAQVWDSGQSKWGEVWKTEPTLDKLVVRGVSQSDYVVNTMDTCKPRTLADVIYRSKYFSDVKPKDRKTVSRITDYAIRQVWHRTGSSVNAFAPRRTHAESLAFLEDHPRLLEAVNFVFTEDTTEKKLSSLFSPGYLAGLMYLMGSSLSESPDDLDWKHWGNTCDYVVKLAGDDSEVAAVRAAIATLSQETGASKAEREAVIIKGWLNYAQEKPITADSLVLRYDTTADGIKILSETPIIGGLDVGGPSCAEDNTITGTSRETITKRTAKTKKKKLAAKKNGDRTTKHTKKKHSPKPTKKKSSLYTVGKTVWVNDEEPIRGKIVEVGEKTCQICVNQGFRGAGNQIHVQKGLLSNKQPPQ